MAAPLIRLRDGRQIEVDSETASEVRAIWQEVQDSHPDRTIEVDARGGERESLRLGDIDDVVAG